MERQCVEQMKQGELKKFLLLFEANFADIYKYVARRIDDRNEVERIVRLTFLDALGQVQNTPLDVNYLVWLQSLAKPRVWEFVAKSSMPTKRGLIAVEDAKGEADQTLIERLDKMMAKLSLEEREILRLKFFEQVTDGDVMMVLGMEEGSIGTKIYRVLKRAHFLLFGESDERQGVYFGELSGLFERVRQMESIEMPEVFRLSLRADLNSRIEKKDYAIEAEFEEEKMPEKPPVQEKNGEEAPKGSNDPAKIFVEAVREMREEEEQEKVKANQRFERRERMLDFFDRWKVLLALVPAVIFVGVIGVVIYNLVDHLWKIPRGYPTSCGIEVVYEGDFADNEIRSINEGVSNKLCDYFEVDRLLITRLEDGSVDVEVEIPEWSLEYKFVKKVKEWRIKKYARTFNSDQQQGEV